MANCRAFDDVAAQGIRWRMPIPDYQTLMLPVLRILGDGADHTAASVIDALATEFKLTPEEREQLVGNQRIKLIASRAHWAMTYLAQAGLTDRPRRGVWCITDEGRRLLATNPGRIDNTVLARYEGFQSFIKRSAGEPDVDEAEALEGGGDTAEAAVGMPSVDDLLRPMLEALSDGKPHAFADLVESISDALHLDDEIRESSPGERTDGHLQPARLDTHQPGESRARRQPERPRRRADRCGKVLSRIPPRPGGHRHAEARLPALPELARRHGRHPRRRAS